MRRRARSVTVRALLERQLPAEARDPFAAAVRAAAAAGVQGALAVSGAVGLLGGVLTLVLLRRKSSVPNLIEVPTRG